MLKLNFLGYGSSQKVNTTTAARETIRQLQRRYLEDRVHQANFCSGNCKPRKKRLLRAAKSAFGLR